MVVLIRKKVYEMNKGNEIVNKVTVVTCISNRTGIISKNAKSHTDIFRSKTISNTRAMMVS